MRWFQRFGAFNKTFCSILLPISLILTYSHIYSGENIFQAHNCSRLFKAGSFYT